MQLSLICSTCESQASEDKREFVGREVWRYLTCGHIEVEKLTPIENMRELVFDDDRKPYDFQFDSIEFGRNSNHRWLCAHQTGLGKTIIATASLALWRKELCPCIVLCKSALKSQWATEVLRACGTTIIPQVFESGKEKPIKGVKAYIISYDLLKNLDLSMFDHCKYVIMDECQQIKNASSARTQAVQQLCAGKDYILGLSATPFKNNLREYFVILNLIDPGRFHDEGWFLDTFVETYWSGNVLKYGGLREETAEYFKSLIKDCVLAYKREDVAPHLPPVVFGQRFLNVEDMQQKSQAMSDYKRELANFDELFDEYEAGGGAEAAKAVSSSLMALKHIAGRMKVPGIVEEVRTFLTENPNNMAPEDGVPRRLVLFTQHIDVANELEQHINKMLDDEFPNVNHVLRIRGDDTPGKKRETATNCALYHWPTQDPFDRILICSTLSGGEGLNLQSAYDGWLCERQWNPANEKEQPAGRFTRHGSKAKNVFFTTWTCLGTVEEQIAEINERKDTYTPNLTGDLSETPWDESSVMMEIANALRDRKRKGLR